jgi:hypothetical protein
MPTPRTTLAGAREYFDSEGTLIDDVTRAELVAVLEAFAIWVRQVP